MDEHHPNQLPLDLYQTSDTNALPCFSLLILDRYPRKFEKKKKTTLQYVALSFENLCHWYIRCCFLLTATIKSSHPTTVVPNVGFIYPWEYEAGSLGVCEKKLVNGRKQINNRTVTNDSINMKGKIYGNRLSRGTQAEGWEPLLYMVTDLLKKSLHMQKWLQKKKRNFL